ncbi:imidazole glycerol phosphate synthase subunit HisH [Candidatus Pantoea edessiphila]|uniref:Imidazole glycerol phosphate synthase subunit HisH n=1 Tax=Candidatus Pantoea edessiphila TaxID=2044610 RepID=A0A2P5SYK0_9GAMM|nr:imidazole glycerol phosphate synthase subunit HisH [Candidatus Pantoea edessiphila]MBK4775456.1 imidazole glycerol phosphate synthase subunit HisH [Pantoea sp. Edef]PPI87417.1 imidazole glycerol phosphate synthase subunit HisH [Candidatus Pantoea edessiphila]
MKVVIIDTGCSNILSIKWAFKRIGYNTYVSCDPDIVLSADKLILPGIGTVKTVMKHLNKKKLINLIKSYKKPVLGICLGMQILGSNSEENEGIKTLGIINEPVLLMNYQNLILPHTGWNKIKFLSNNDLFKNIQDNSYFYFMHSYAMPLSTNTIGQFYHGKTFTAVMQKDNFFGVQFHPERSSKAGLQLLKNFLEI